MTMYTKASAALAAMMMLTGTAAADGEDRTAAADGPATAPPADAPPPAKVASVPQARLDLNEDGSAYLRLITWHQLWVRTAEMNPGTLVNGDEADWAFDVGIRRSRFLALAEYDRAQLVFHLGINNQTFTSERKPQLYVHDVWASFDVLGPYLTLGAGLHYWNGVSRMANASTITFLGIDAPIVNWPTIERTDQFGRQLGVFAKGQIDALDYRLAVNRPFSTTRSLEPGAGADYRPDANSVALAGYAQWFFLDKESNKLPYTVGSYHGSKRVLNVGAGAHWNPSAMGQMDDMGTVDEHDLLAIGADVFADHPVGGGFALTGYAGFYYYDFGPDHVRNVGIMNVGTGGTSYNGAGNAYPALGTGEHVYLQTGLLVPTPTRLRIQPYLTFQWSEMDALDDASIIVEGGANWLHAGHRAKLTTHVRSRPIFNAEEGTIEEIDRSTEFIMQLQLFL